MAPRRLVLGAALLAAIAASIWATSQPDADAVSAVVAPASRARAVADPAPRDTAGADAIAPLEIGSRPEPASSAHDLFAAYSWQPPPPPRLSAAAAAAAAPPPSAPQPSFAYVGRLQSGDHRSFLFVDGTRTQVVAPGDRIGDFRLDSADGNSITFTHLPTGLPVTVAAPAAGDR